MTRDFIDGERKRTVANLVVECLEKECVRHVFAFPGEEREDLLFALADSAVSFVPCRHEQGAAFIADFWWPADRHRQVISTRSLAGQRGRKIVLALRCLRQLIKEGLAF
jgi:hypothetical protein